MYLFSIHQIYSKGNSIFLILSDVHFLYTSVGRENFDVYPMYTLLLNLSITCLHIFCGVYFLYIPVMNCIKIGQGCILIVYIIAQPTNNSCGVLIHMYVRTNSLGTRKDDYLWHVHLYTLQLPFLTCNPVYMHIKESPRFNCIINFLHNQTSFVFEKKIQNHGRL